MIFLAFHVVLVVLSDLFGTFDDGSWVRWWSNTYLCDYSEGKKRVTVNLTHEATFFLGCVIKCKLSHC